MLVQEEAYFNFVNSINPDATRKNYEYCMSRFLKYCNLDLDSLLKLPATRIAELMKVDRNTINNDLKILYYKALQDYNPGNINLDDILQKQLLRLETQRDRLGLYLCEANDINSKIAIERLIADIVFKLIRVIERMGQNVVQYWDEIIKHINVIAENEKLKTRYTSIFELRKISIDSRESLNKLKEQVFP